MSVRTALSLINQVVNEVRTERQDEFDADTRWAIDWFAQYRYGEGAFGLADVLARAKDVSVAGLVEAGIAKAGAGKVRLYRPSELEADWDPITDHRVPIWELTHRLVHALTEGSGIYGAAEIARRSGGRADLARDLAYQLFEVSNEKGWADDALTFNSLIIDWPEIQLAVSRAGVQGNLGLEDR
jgi:putative DNA methylase